MRSRMMTSKRSRIANLDPVASVLGDLGVMPARSQTVGQEARGLFVVLDDQDSHSVGTTLGRPGIGRTEAPIPQLSVPCIAERLKTLTGRFRALDRRSGDFGPPRRKSGGNYNVSQCTLVTALD